METASAIALSLPTSEGGVGIRGIELNKPLEIPQRLWHCTKARTLKIDALITYKRRELGIEYKGGFHDEFERKGADAEREAVLSQMGYRIVTLTSAQFGSSSPSPRMNNIREALGMPRCTDTGTRENKTNYARHLSATGKAYETRRHLPNSAAPVSSIQTCTSAFKDVEKCRFWRVTYMFGGSVGIETYFDNKKSPHCLGLIPSNGGGGGFEPS